MPTASAPFVAPPVGKRTAGNARVLALGATLLLVHNALVVAGIGEVATFIANGLIALGVVLVGRRWRLERVDLGVGVDRRSIVLSVVAAAAIVAIVAALALLGLLPADPHPAGLSPGEFWFRVLIGIPIGTAVFEELIFRGVLLGAWTRSTSTRAAVIATSVTFGLWHVAAEIGRSGQLSPAGIVPGVVATATVSVFVLCPLRRRTGNLLAPITVHAATNVSVFVAIALASRAVV